MQYIHQELNHDVNGTHVPYYCIYFDWSHLIATTESEFHSGGTTKMYKKTCIIRRQYFSGERQHIWTFAGFFVNEVFFYLDKFPHTFQLK